jgi:hypothetical protein
MTNEPSLTAVLFIDGEEVRRRVLTTDNVGFLGPGDAELCAQAGREGKVWRLEVTDPGGDIEPVVLSNDSSGMRTPIPIDDIF